MSSSTDASCRSRRRTTSTTTSTWASSRGWPSWGSWARRSRPSTAAPGLDYVCEALICEEIERGESAFRTLISVHVGLNSLSLLRFGSDEQHRRYLEPMAKGEKLGCFGLTEPAAGSDVAAMLTTAIRQDDGTYLLNGQKNWISYATEADYALVFAKTDPSAGHRGISAFVVERAWEGVEARPIPQQARDLGRLDGRALLLERAGAGREPGRRGGRRLQDRDALARPGPVHGRRRRGGRHPGLPGGVGQVRERAPDVRPAASASTSSCRT